MDGGRAGDQHAEEMLELVGGASARVGNAV